MSEHNQAPQIPAGYAHMCNQILSLKFDKPGAKITFADKLSQQNRWRMTFSERAKLEYLRLVCIWAMTGQAVAPSWVVDQVWHLHLQYTISYWHEMCRDILKKEFHHMPGNGSVSDKQRDSSAYENTLTLYRQFFGEPPADIWDVGPRPVNGVIWMRWLRRTRICSAVASMLRAA